MISEALQEFCNAIDYDFSVALQVLDRAADRNPHDAELLRGLELLAAVPGRSTRERLDAMAAFIALTQLPPGLVRIENLLEFVGWTAPRLQ